MMLPVVDLSAWMPFLLLWRTLLRHYMPTAQPSPLNRAFFTGYDASRISTRRKKWPCSFFVVVESKSNRSCNSRLKYAGNNTFWGLLTGYLETIGWTFTKLTVPMMQYETRDKRNKFRSQRSRSQWDNVLETGLYGRMQTVLDCLTHRCRVWASGLNFAVYLSLVSL